MHKIKGKTISDKIAELCILANYELSDDVLQALHNAMSEETSSRAREILQQIIDNANLAKTERTPICQDTGIVIVFLEIGQEVVIEGGLEESINEGVRRGYRDGYLRSSIVADPLNRVNTKDNTPAVIHTKITPGDRLKITVVPKGSGSGNMSVIRMLRPSDGEKEISDFVIQHIRKVGAYSCPPLIIGIGLGGTFEKSAILAKEALLRRIGESHSDPRIARLERSILSEINNLGIGPAGLGGRTTSLAVHIKTYPTHIASLPVAININCHAHRYREAIL
jgi:fumarate hydratase subunit alpha